MGLLELQDRYDVICVGGGLSNLLLAYRLKQAHPSLTLLIVDESHLTQSRTWIHFGGDLPEWMAPLVSRSWDGYEVFFDRYLRRLHGGVHSLRQREVMELLDASWCLGERVSGISNHQVTLATGKVINAGCVLDGRGWEAKTREPWGFHVFVGYGVELKAPHGLRRPLLVDTRGLERGYFSVFPRDEKTLLIRYGDWTQDPRVDEAAVERRVRDYLGYHGFEFARVTEREVARLPLPLARPKERLGLPCVGVRGGFFHPNLGTTVQDAVEVAERVASLQQLRTNEVKAALQSLRGSAPHGFSLFLNRVWFESATHKQRISLMESFFKGREARINRFVLGKESLWDKARALAGRPRVAPWRVVKQVRPL